MKTSKKYFMECHVAGRQYHDADDVWEDLKVGTKLKLVRDMENRYDPEAVALVYEREECCEPVPYLIGYIPKALNKELAILLEMGWDDIFECRISMIDPQAHYEEQIHVSIKVLKK